MPDKLPIHPRNNEAQIDVPECLQNESFQAAWQDWITYRHQARKTLTPIAAKRCIAKLAGFGLDAAVASIYRSIDNGWSGLWSPKLPENKPVVEDADAWLARIQEEG